MIDVQQVSYTYPTGQKALLDVDVKVKEGDFIAIMGENGAGKTTLVKHLNGLLKPSNGRVLVDDLDTKKESVAKVSRKVGIVFQNPDHQLFCETVKEEVAFALNNFGFPRSIVEKRVEHMLEMMDLSRYRDSSPFSLSGGERKRVALASILAWDPKYVVMDEPTIGQDYRQKERLRNFIVQLTSQGKAVIIVTHDVEFVAECHPRIILLSHGRVVKEGDAEEILTQKRLLDKCSLTLPQITQLMQLLQPHGIGGKALDPYSALPILKKVIKR